MNLRLTRGEIPDHLLKYFKPIGHKQKDLINTPYYMAEALREDGWYLRADIAWCKAAPMPESVRDRPTSAWEHIWILTKSGRYFWDADAVRIPHAYDWSTHSGGSITGSKQQEQAHDGAFEGSNRNNRHDRPSAVFNPAGANLRNYWVLPPDPYPGAHFATFPREIPRRCILAATSEYGACAACGAPYKRETERTAVPLQATYNGAQVNNSAAAPPGSATRWSGGTGKPSRVDVQHIGWTPTCRCNPAAGVRPCIVLDPFAGSFTSVYVAASLGRIGVGVELSQSYIEQARYGRLAQDFLPFDAPRRQPLAGPIREAG